MSEYHSSIDTKVQQLVDEDLRRALFARATEAMAMNVDDEDFKKRSDILTVDGADTLWDKPESATHRFSAESLDNPWELYDLGVEGVTMTYFPPRQGGGKEYAESIVIDLLPLGSDRKNSDSLAYKLQLYEPATPGLFELEEVDITKIERSAPKGSVVGEATHDDVEHLQRVLEVLYHHEDPTVETLATP